MQTWTLILALAALTVCAAASAQQRRPVTLYVSKLGDNTDGRSWQTAFHTIQQALDAVPPGGGHKIIVRPDVYCEAMLAPAHKGEPGAYNELIGDLDGSLGSGTSGWVIVDSGDPSGRGFKSYDWWGPIRSYKHGWSPEHTGPTFSAIAWDRWRLRGIYATGGDGGIFFDLVDQTKPFSVIVDDCVGIGRAFGGGAASFLARPGEPIIFRRCHLWALDWWGDTAGAYARAENSAMPGRPDITFQDCVMVGPQCALKAGNFGFHTYTYISARRCLLAALNFSQPRGTPTDGVIQSVQNGRYLRVDLEDCTLVGYKVFGVMVDKQSEGEIIYTCRGDVKAYVQFQQQVPEGMFRLGWWPAELFAQLAPPHRRPDSPFVSRELVRENLCELTPVLWRGRLLHLECVRPGSGGKPEEHFLQFRDAETGQVICQFARGYGLASAIAHGGTMFVFASRREPGAWRDVTVFWSKDLQNWQHKLALRGEGEQIFNTSVCAAPDGFVMAYETNDPAYPAFTIKFARSNDLLEWSKIPGAIFGRNRYTACPCIRFAGGYFYMLYLEHRRPRWHFETYIARSRDLKRWELAGANPVLAPHGLDEGINASDPEIIELGGRTYVYFAVGDQRSWANVKRAIYPGPMAEFFQRWFQGTNYPEPR